MRPIVTGRRAVACALSLAFATACSIAFLPDGTAPRLGLDATATPLRPALRALAPLAADVAALPYLGCPPPALRGPDTPLPRAHARRTAAQPGRPGCQLRSAWRL